MDTFNQLLHGFWIAATPVNLLWSLLGVTLGTAIGVLPGIGPSATIALLLPLTFQGDPISAFILFGGIYYGAMYGGSTTSILLNMPGESTSLMTAIDGYQMARKGRAAAALATAAIGSFVAGTIATIALTFVAPVIVSFALKFGPAEYFMLAVLAFSTTTALVGRSITRGLASLAIGILAGFVGLDLQTGQARMTFGAMELLDGFSLSTISVGLFAVGEVFHLALHPQLEEHSTTQPISGKIGMTREDLSRSWRPWLRGTFIGFPLGALPAGGGEIPTFISYFVEKTFSRRRHEFGHGAIEGVAGPEAANNASTAGVLLPLLTLGLPTSATAAIMLSALQGYGLKPGPFLLQDQPDLVWSFVASLLIGNFFLLVLNLPLARVWARMLTIPQPPLLAAILVLSTISTYAISQSAFDLVVLYAFGVLGYFMRRLDFPQTPLIVGMILGPMAEQQFRRAMAISQGDLGVFVSHSLSLSLLILGLLSLLGPPMVRVLRQLPRQAIEKVETAV
ncbi:tripartite tricarboxylate transporter permease [Agrobacterium vitis]